MALTPLNLRMRRSFVTAHGRKAVSRNLLVAVRLSNGITGYGEASASLAWPEETQPAMTRALKRIAPKMTRQGIRGVQRLISWGWKTAREHPAAAAALECALWDAYARWRGISLWRMWGGRRRSVTTALTISAWEPSVAGRAAQMAAAQGFRRLKVKLAGKDLDEDIRRILAVHRAAPRAALWVDANQGLRVREAVSLSRTLRERRIPVELLEQPVPREEIEGLAQTQRDGGIPVAADESARTPEEALRLMRKKAVSVINVKLAKMGIRGAQAVMTWAPSYGVKLMIGCMAESAIGLSHSVALACGSGAFSYVDLDSHLLVVSPRCRPGFSSRGPRLGVFPSRPGCGAELPTPR